MSLCVWRGGPFITARIEVGSRVFVCQGPPVDVQHAQEPDRTPQCIGDEVQKAVQFASMQVGDASARVR